jgi:hypothetical protein
MEAAATIGVACDSAAIGLYAPKPLGAALSHSLDGQPRYTGQPVLVIGGSSSVGQYGSYAVFQFTRHVDTDGSGSFAIPQTVWV